MRGLPKNYLPSVVWAKVCGPYSALVVFDDGVSKQINLRRLMKGPVFKPFRTPAGFARLRVENHTITWSDQADIAPETLYSLPDERKRARQSRTRSRRKKSRRGSSSAA